MNFKEVMKRVYSQFIELALLMSIISNFILFGFLSYTYFSSFNKILLYFSIIIMLNMVLCIEVLIHNREETIKMIKGLRK